VHVQVLRAADGRVSRVHFAGCIETEAVWQFPGINQTIVCKFEEIASSGGFDTPFVTNAQGYSTSGLAMT
jgi:hypothetical protein